MDSFLEGPSAWHVSLHMQADRAVTTKALHWRGRELKALNVSASELTKPFPVHFDTFIENINQLSGGYAEGDGSFGLVGPDGQWKVCGNIFEYNDKLQYVELQGHCPDSAWAILIAQLGVPLENCILQNMQGGFFQSLDQFLASQS